MGSSRFDSLAIVEVWIGGPYGAFQSLQLLLMHVRALAVHVERRRGDHVTGSLQ